MLNPVDRRRHPRFAVNAAYTSARLRRQRDDAFTLDGHVWDISEGGVRLECDEPIDPGTPVAVQIDLPSVGEFSDDVDGPGRAVFVIGNVVWCDIEEPGPAQLAIAITRFAREGDKSRLMRRLARDVSFARVA